MKKIIVLGVVLGLVLSINPVDFEKAQAQMAPFQVGGSVMIYGAWPSSVNVRVSPCTFSFGCNVIGKVQDGATGVITDGPRSGSGYTWWKVRFSFSGVLGLEGWVVDNYLRSTTPVPGSGSGGQDLPTPAPVGSFSLPAGGEFWQQGQNQVLSWNTPTAWSVSEVSLILVDLSGNNIRSIAVIKNNVPVSIQGGGDFVWTIPASVVNGDYKIKATVNRSDTSSPSVILSNQFSIGIQSGGGGGEEGGGGTGGGETGNTTTLFTGCSTNAPVTPMPTGNQAPTIIYFNAPSFVYSDQSLNTWTAAGFDLNSNVFFYQINWGDGNYSCWSSAGYPYGVSGVTHTFAPGTYQVKLRVIDIYGAYTESVKSFTVGGTTPVNPPIINQPPPPQAPVITSFGIKDQSMGAPNVPYALVFSATDADSTGLKSYSINWGDGSGVASDEISGTSVTREVSHTYSAVGRYLVDLTVTDATNLTATQRTSVSIQATPVACSTRFVIGDRVRVINVGAENPLNVRSTPEIPANRDANKLGGHYAGDLGTVIGGPQAANSYCWWNINYDTNPDGWSAEGVGGVFWLEKVSSGSTPPPITNLPPPPPDDSNTGSQSGFSSAGVATNLVVGDYVRTSYYTPVFVREEPNGNVMSAQLNGSTGRIVSGPVLAEGLIWWKIDYVNPPDGWSAERAPDGTVLLTKIAGPVSNDPIIPGQTTNQPPVLGQITQVTAPGVNIPGVWQVSATDPNGGNLTYSVDWGDGMPPTSYTGSSGQVINITRTYTQSGPRNITVSVSDGQTTVTGTPFSVNVGGSTGGSNQAPMLDPLTAPAQATRSVNTTWQIRATDPNGGTLTYTVSWGDGMANSTYTGASGQSVSASHSYATIGNKTITVTVSDGSLTDSKTLTVNVIAGGGSTQGPSSQISGPYVAVSGVATSWQFIAYDPDSPSISFVINWGDGTSSNFSGAPGVAKMMEHTYSQTGQRTITVTATDNTGLSHGSSWGINVTTPDLATAKPNVPTVVGPTQVTAGVNTSWTVTLNDPDTNSLTYTVNWNDGSAIENGTAVRGVPFIISHTYAQFTGYKSIVINVSDGTNTEWTTKNITAKLSNQAPTIGSVSGPADVKTATTRTWYITGTDPEGVAVNYTFNWGDGTSNNYTGKASGVSFGTSHIYSQSGTFMITVTVTDNGGLSATSGAYTVRANKFAVNERVEVSPTLTTALVVRATPSPTGVYIGGVYPLSKYGTKGTILEGPVVAGGYTWWKVAWDSTMTGWSAEDWLVKTN